MHNIYKRLKTGIKIKNKMVREGDILDFGCWKQGHGERAIVEYSPSKAAFTMFFYSKWGGEGCDYLQAITKTGYNYKGTTKVIGSIYTPGDLKKCTVTCVSSKDLRLAE